MNQIAKFIVKQIREESISGFQQVVTYEEVEEKFGMEEISEVIANAIADELGEFEEVADVELDEDGFDVVLYTDHALSYDSTQND